MGKLLQLDSKKAGTMRQKPNSKACHRNEAGGSMFLGFSRTGLILNETVIAMEFHGEVESTVSWVGKPAPCGVLSA